MFKYFKKICFNNFGVLVNITPTLLSGSLVIFNVDRAGKKEVVITLRKDPHHILEEKIHPRWRSVL